MNRDEFDEDGWLRGMRIYYLSRADHKLNELIDAITRLEQSPQSPTAYRRLDRLLHNLIGSGGSYGMPEVSDAAREMLRRLKCANQSRALSESELMSELQAGVDELKHIFTDACVREGPIISDSSP